MMQKINELKIVEAVSALCIQANVRLREDVETALKAAERHESLPRAKKILRTLLENAKVAGMENIALCQDTGLPIVFVEIGKNIDTRGVDLAGAINKGVREGYARGFLRSSIVSDPLLRLDSSFGPCVIHFDFRARRGLGLDVLPKGFGCENKTKLKMFNPTAAWPEIRDFIVSAVRDAGPDACPPYVIGVGIGGTADYVGLLAKKALLRKVTKLQSHKVTSRMAKLEKELLVAINRLNIGPMGLGGKTTALGVNILTSPTHIAGLPVCVNISCHVLRSAHAELF